MSWAQNVEPGIEMVAPDQLLANPWNYRIHTEKQREALRNSLDDVGWVRPVLVNRTTGHIVDGHARVEEADKRGEMVPVQYCNLNEEQEREALASLDTIAAMASVDKDKLRELIAQVRAKGAPIWQELLRLVRDGAVRVADAASDPDPREDEAEVLRQEWGTELGQTWAIPSQAVQGRSHRLVIGDCTQPGVLRALVPADTPARCMWTDPPYGVNYQGAAGAIDNDDPRGLQSLLAAAFAQADTVLVPGAAWYICCPAGPQGLTFRLVLDARKDRY